MFRYHFILLLLVTVTYGYGQDLNELEKRHGFKDIRLDSHIDSVRGTKLKKDFKEKDEFQAKLYTVEHPDYEKIGEVKVARIELKTYKDIIYEISVITDKDPRVMKALESLYGKAEYDLKNETYFWKTNNLALKFRSEGKNRLELVYTSYLVHKTMKDDKNKKVVDIADDF